MRCADSGKMDSGYVSPPSITVCVSDWLIEALVNSKVGRIVLQSVKHFPHKLDETDLKNA